MSSELFLGIIALSARSPSSAKPKPLTGSSRQGLWLSPQAPLRLCYPVEIMKAGIHPAYDIVKVSCACGSTFQTRSTNKTDLRVEICSACHPFFTGRQKLIDTEGRVDRFNKRMAKSDSMKKAREVAPAPTA